MKISKKKLIPMGTAVILAGAVLIGGGTYSYLSQTTNDITNNFNAGIVQVELKETTGQQYNIIPGTTEAKDPKVIVDNTVDCYVYVKVTDTTAGLVNYAIADGWEKLDGYTNVYYREVKASASENPQEFSVLKDDKVGYASTLKNDSMIDDKSGALKEGLNLTFKVSAIQKELFNDAVNAYYVINAESVDNADDVVTKLNDDTTTCIISNGDICIYDKTISTNISINEQNKTWIINGTFCSLPPNNPNIYSVIDVKNSTLTLICNTEIEKVSYSDYDKQKDKVMVFDLRDNGKLIVKTPNGTKEYTYDGTGMYVHLLFKE